MIRITGGEDKGKRINVPKGLQTRPSTDFLRQAVFNLLQKDIRHANFLDLFAGSGAFGIEALSRGATHATFVDQSAAAIACIRKNIDALDFRDRATILRADSTRWLKKNSTQFDIAYIDPPYDRSDLYGEILHICNRLKPAHQILVEDQYGKDFKDILENYQRTTIRKYGGCFVQIYQSL